ncbi:ATP-binding cassette domain-containing protein [Sphingobacterium sp. DK4209]|uniref:ATP-binding cassette domain-containing protein n=1 Tax=Sphingobacterium zhuxiongii TaxID=2662364 RepID=A0A5Q0QE54_9SPHI|nr:MULTISPECIES: ABC transporter ATP-binding protein [unclassified Sphingobacterium]MVZ66533.1 ATP-binding cassette domain-containing protein [Sphingobacterium sp. DK4209]QGA27813.1 ATP-binding cassette domain-containing protein [Sphingobacterium sp. dk4302]
MIEIKDLSKHYNGVQVLNIPELNINEGESIGLVGNNGAGKTTLFSLILDLIQPDFGNVKLKGIQVQGDGGWKQFTTAFIDESFLIGYLSPGEYFYFLGELRGMNKEDVDRFVSQFAEFFNGEVLNRKVYIRDLSKGNQKKVGIIGALIGEPELVILDEPFANLDPTTQFRLKSLLLKLKNEHRVTLLISSHDLSHTVDTADRIIALNKGIIVKDSIKTEETLSELNAFFAVE